MWPVLLAAAAPAPAPPVTVSSQAGHFTLAVTGLDRPEPINHLHGIAVLLATADGAPVTGASIVLTGRQRYALNPLPTSPRVVPAPGAGRYRIEGLRFHMPGDWRLDFVIDFKHIRDHATLDLVVK